MKVLDAANVPEKKSFPPRLLIIFLGTTLAFAAATTWVFGKTNWDQTDANDPRKVLAQEVLTTVRSRLPRFSRNGSGNHVGSESLPGGIQRRSDEEDDRTVLK